MNALAGQTGQGSIIVVFKITDFFSDPTLNVLSGDGALKKKGRHKISAAKNGGGTPGRGTASASYRNHRSMFFIPHPASALIDQDQIAKLSGLAHRDDGGTRGQIRTAPKRPRSWLRLLSLPALFKHGRRPTQPYRHARGRTRPHA
jgi:hypothetical protein